MFSMKYAVMRFGGSVGPGGRSRTIFVLPASSRTGEFVVIYPEILGKRLDELLAATGIRIRQFDGCSTEALTAVRRKLVGLVAKKLEDYARIPPPAVNTISSASGSGSGSVHPMIPSTAMIAPAATIRLQLPA